MNRIKQLRNQQNMSQEELAKQLGVAQNTISQWERGAREVDNTQLFKIAGFFNVSIDYLLGYTNAPEVMDEEYGSAIQAISEAVAKSSIADDIKDMNPEELEAYTKAFIQYMKDNAKYIKAIAKDNKEE